MVLQFFAGLYLPAMARLALRRPPDEMRWWWLTPAFNLHISLFLHAADALLYLLYKQKYYTHQQMQT